MRQKGFTLIELLVAVAIIAILSAIALPSYNSYILKSRRMDAKDALVTVQFAQEKYRGNNTTYATTLAQLGLAASSTQGYYTLTITAGDETQYGATATVNPASAQAPDSKQCPALRVDQKGFIKDATASCWGL